MASLRLRSRLGTSETRSRLGTSETTGLLLMNTSIWEGGIKPWIVFGNLDDLKRRTIRVGFVTGCGQVLNFMLPFTMEAPDPSKRFPSGGHRRFTNLTSLPP